MVTGVQLIDLPGFDEIASPSNAYNSLKTRVLMIMAPAASHIVWQIAIASCRSWNSIALKTELMFCSFLCSFFIDKRAKYLIPL